MNLAFASFLPCISCGCFPNTVNQPKFASFFPIQMQIKGIFLSSIIQLSAILAPTEFQLYHIALPFDGQSDVHDEA
jgi:hypothetical protein